MVKHRKRALWAVPLALAVLATACGGDDDERAATSTTAGSGDGSRRRAGAERRVEPRRASAPTTS